MGLRIIVQGQRLLEAHAEFVEAAEIARDGSLKLSHLYPAPGHSMVCKPQIRSIEGLASAPNEGATGPSILRHDLRPDICPVVRWFLRGCWLASDPPWGIEASPRKSLTPTPPVPFPFRNNRPVTLPGGRWGGNAGTGRLEPLRGCRQT